MKHYLEKSLLKSSEVGLIHAFLVGHHVTEELTTTYLGII